MKARGKQRERVKNSEGNTGGQCSKRGGGGGRNYCAAVSQTDNPAPEPEKEVAEEDREILRMNASCHPAGTTSGGHHFMSAPQPSTPSAPPPSTCRGREQEQLLADPLPGTPAAQYTLHRPAGRVVQPPWASGSAAATGPGTHHQGRGHCEHFCGAVRDDADADGCDGEGAAAVGTQRQLEDGGDDESNCRGVEAGQGAAVYLPLPAAMGPAGQAQGAPGCS